MHRATVSERWCKFITQAQAFVVDTGSQVQDSLWLIWKLPDEVWQQINPDFFKNDKGKEWHPPLP
jgi:adenylate kinase